jgi:hypothetical protein
MKSLLLSIVTVLALATPSFANDSCRKQVELHTFKTKQYDTAVAFKDKYIPASQIEAAIIREAFSQANVPTTCVTLSAVEAGWSLPQIIQTFGNN